MSIRPLPRPRPWLRGRADRTVVPEMRIHTFMVSEFSLKMIQVIFLADPRAEITEISVCPPLNFLQKRFFFDFELFETFLQTVLPESHFLWHPNNYKSQVLFFLQKCTKMGGDEKKVKVKIMLLL